MSAADRLFGRSTVLPSGLLVPGAAGASGLRSRGVGGIRVPPVSPDRREPGPLLSYQSVYDGAPIVYAVSNILIRNSARVPLMVERPGEGNRWSRVEPEHNLCRLLERPSRNPALTMFRLMVAIQHGLHIDGNQTTYVHRDGPDGEPTELMPLDWSLMGAVRQPGGLVNKWISRELGAEPLLLDPAEVLHFAWWSANSPAGQIGLAPLEPLATTIGVENAAARHSYAVLGTSADPSGAFEMPPDVDLEDEDVVMLRELIESWSSPDEHGVVPILARGAKWVQFTKSAGDAALIETRHRNAEEVCMAYGVTPVDVGLLKDATQRGNLSELRADLFSNKLGLPLALVCDAINGQLIGNTPAWREERLRVRPDMDEFMRGDPKTWNEIVNSRLLSGRLTLNGAREIDGEEPYDDPKANEPFIADNNLHPLSQVGEPEK